MRVHAKSHRGFTLVEMIVVIVITGIIAGMVAIFIRAPVQGYMDSARRAEMSDIADNALRRLGRDLRTAVPNSVRVPSLPSTYFEYLPTSSGGRYRVTNVGVGACGGAGNELDFGAADICFEIVGSPITFGVSDAIVVGSTQSSGNAAYQKTTSLVGGIRVGGVLRDYTGGAGAHSAVAMAGAAQFPAAAELEGHRFEVVPGDQQAVTYACLGMAAGALDANGNGQGMLWRYWHYGYFDTAAGGQPTPAAISGMPHGKAILAGNVSDCNFVYDTSNARNSLMAISLTITRGGESVHLYHEIHVNNIP